MKPSPQDKKRSWQVIRLRDLSDQLTLHRHHSSTCRVGTKELLLCNEALVLPATPGYVHFVPPSSAFSVRVSIAPPPIHSSGPVQFVSILLKITIEYLPRQAAVITAEASDVFAVDSSHERTLERENRRLRPMRNAGSGPSAKVMSKAKAKRHLSFSLNTHPLHRAAVYLARAFPSVSFFRTQRPPGEMQPKSRKMKSTTPQNPRRP